MQSPRGLRPNFLQRFLVLGLLLWLQACGHNPHATPLSLASLQQQVMDTETAFAETMARRDLAAFSGFVSEQAVFFSGPTPLRGKSAVVAWWSRYFQGKQAPFSWKPEHVQVLDAGHLALSTGPVLDPTGKKVATFTSVWAQQAPGQWRIVFDKGDSACDCAPKP